LARLRLVRDERDEEAVRDLVGGVVLVGEDEDALAAAALEDLLEGVELARRGERDAPLLAPRLERVAALGVAARLDQEARPAARRSEPEAAAVEEAAPPGARRLVGRALALRERDEHGHDLVGRERVARELFDLFAIDERTDEVVEQRVAAIETLGRRREPEPERRDRELGGEREGGSGEVVRLIIDDEPEAVAEPVEVEVRRVVGRDRQVLDGELARADGADLAPREAAREHRVPLMEE